MKDATISSLGDTLPATVFAQSPASETFAIRTAGNPLAIVPIIREEVRQIDPNLPLLDFKTQLEQVHEGFAATNTVTVTCSFFGGVALLLTCIGLYGLLSYNVARRTNEIGVRMALGARRLQIIRLVMDQTMYLVLIGLALGLAASLAFNRTIHAFILGVSPYDPITLITVIVILLTVTALAGYLPARRASRVDPTVALRHE